MHLIHIITSPHPKDGGRYCFQFVCQFKSRGGVPQSGLGAVPHPRSDWGGGTPSQVWLGGSRSDQDGVTPPPPGLDGVPSPPQTWDGDPPGHGMGYPPGPEMGYSLRHGTGYPPDIGWGTPQTLDGVPPQTWDGVPPGPGTGYPPGPGMGYPPRHGTGYPPTDQHSEHLLHGGRYASCVHAGGLSCSIFTSEIV